MLLGLLLTSASLVAVTAYAAWITFARRRSLAIYQAVFDTAVDAIITIDQRGIIHSYNPAAQRLFGYEPREVVGRNVSVLMPEPYRSAHDGYLDRYHHTAERRIIGIGREVAAQRKDGSVFPIDLAVGEAHLGQRIYTGIIRDITARKQAEAEREHLLECERAARTEAERATRVKDEFLAMVSHELRTPLTAILGWVSMLERGATGEVAARALRIIKSNALTQARMVEDLLDLSRLAHGKLLTEKRLVDLRDVVEGALGALEPAAAARRISLSKSLGSSALRVLGDPGRLQQIVDNLLSNALKFTPEGGSVTVALRERGELTDVVVSDTGQGIAAEFLPRVFERWAQVDDGPSRRQKGLGLGLALVRHFSELHGGTVRADSEGDGRGSTFTVTLPLANGALDELLAESPCASLQGVRVLVVDDEPDVCELVRRILEGCEADVVAVCSASEALDEIQKRPPDVVLSDIGMPKQDGYQLARALRSLDPEHGGSTPAAALTAFVRPEDRERALEAGFQRHIGKPIDPGDLVRTVAELCHRAAA